ncbi:MAG: YopT-type cysteine protease domain-containing protein [Terriglobia bacterium]
MARQILYMGGFDSSGVCHTICCEWIRQSRDLGNVTRVRELESPLTCRADWDPATGWRAINETYNLPVDHVVWRARFDSDWLADHCARIHGYALIVLWNGGIYPPNRTHGLEGHTVALRKQPGRIQYFDPNLGTLEIDNAQELGCWLRNSLNAPGGRYPGLRGRRCELVLV